MDATTRERTLAHLADALTAGQRRANRAAHDGIRAHLGCQARGATPSRVRNRPEMADERAWRFIGSTATAGTAEPISTRDGLVAPDVAGIVEVFRAAKAGKGV